MEIVEEFKKLGNLVENKLRNPEEMLGGRTQKVKTTQDNTDICVDPGYEHASRQHMIKAHSSCSLAFLKSPLGRRELNQSKGKNAVQQDAGGLYQPILWGEGSSLLGASIHTSELVTSYWCVKNTTAAQ